VTQVAAAPPHTQLLTVCAERQRSCAGFASRTSAQTWHRHRQQQPHERHRHQPATVFLVTVLSGWLTSLYLCTASTCYC